MCGTCGCADPANAVTLTDPDSGEKAHLRQGVTTERDQGRHQDHGHDHDLPHLHGPGGEVITLEQAVLAKNDRSALRNRRWFEDRGVLALNLVSSPGAGKTTLLERTIRELAGRLEISVVEGDQMTAKDAERIRAAGGRAIQINTGAGCHLEADMVAEALRRLDPRPGSILMIENVGNLVCPALFDLGERMKVAVISTPEGDDKPLKYPHMFRAAEVVIMNKLDLAPHVDFDHELCRDSIRQVNPDARVFALSVRSGEGFRPWLDFLTGQVEMISVRDDV